MEGGSGKMEAIPFTSLFAALSYGAASMAMVFINKAILMQYSYLMSLLSLQQIATTVLIHLCRINGYAKAKAFDMAMAKKLLPVSLFYNANVLFALASLKGVNIPMYIALKRLTPLAVLVAGFFSGKGKPPLQVSLSVLFTAIGVVIAAVGDFSFDLFGYSMALTSVFFQTMYLVLIEKSGAEDGLSSVEIMYYNSLLSIPFLLFLVIATGEFPNSLTALSIKVSSTSFLVTFVLSLLMGIALNYTMFLCTVVNSALTTTIVGVLKGVGTTVRLLNLFYCTSCWAKMHKHVQSGISFVLFLEQISETMVMLSNLNIKLKQPQKCRHTIFSVENFFKKRSKNYGTEAT